MIWTRISLLLCVFGFLKEFRPSEPFLTDYLTGHWKNFTAQEVNQQILPINTYTYVSVVVAVLLLTDFLRYKPVIILCGISGSCAYALLIFAKTTRDMQIGQVLCGIFYATEVAYFTYMYAKVAKVHYQEVTSNARVALLLGRFTASVVSQLAVSLDFLDYHQLNFLTLSALVLSAIWSFFLPSVTESVYFHRPMDSTSREPSKPESEISTIESAQGTNEFGNSRHDLHPDSLKLQPTFGMKLKNAYHLLWKDFLRAYSNLHVLKWSIWSAFATCGWTQALFYVQLLWQDSVGKEDDPHTYNAGVEVVHAILGALGTFIVGKLKLNWLVLGEATLSTFALLQGTLLLFASQSYNIWFSYIAYISVGVMYQAMITVASSEIAKNLSEDSYGLIFGLNTFVALLLQSLLTFLVTGGVVFALSIRSQYVVYGAYFFILGVAFMIIAVFTTVRQCRSGKRFDLWQPSEHVVSSR